jgi:ubiquinone/menaquinone biosynthesis C-methylase UbiE
MHGALPRVFAGVILSFMKRADSHRHYGAHHHDHNRDHYGNPRDLKAYLARLEGPARKEWQKPDSVVRSLCLRPGQTVVEIGPGPGFFTLRLAKAVGKRGRVFAAEIEPKMIAILRDRLEQKKVTNVTPVLASQHDPHLPAGLADVVFIVNTFHHVPNGSAYLRPLEACPMPGGRLVNIDFREGDLPVGPPADHKMSRADFLKLAKAVGFTLAAEHTFLPYQYFVELRCRPLKAR